MMPANSTGPRIAEIHEDLVQGRARQLEAGEPRAGRDQALEDLLRVRARSELELRLLTEILNLGDEAPVREDLLRVALAAIERHDHVLTAVGALHLRERAVDQFPAARNNA